MCTRREPEVSSNIPVDFGEKIRVVYTAAADGEPDGGSAMVLLPRCLLALS